MRLRRLFTNVSFWTAVLTGIAGGLALAAWSAPSVAFSYDRVSIVSWRGDWDRVPNNIASVGWSGPMFYTTAEEGAGQSGPQGRYPTGKWAPGDTFSRTLTVKNVDCDDSFTLEGLQMRLRGDALLASRLTLTIENQAQLLYSGALADLSVQLSAPIRLPRGERTDLTFTVSFDRESDNTYQARTLQADIIVLASQTIYPIVVDVHPASWPNPINPGSKGTIPVAVNGSADLNVRTLDWETARFGPNRVAPLRRSYADWNRDGYTDLMLKFDNRTSGFTCGMTEATLTISGEDGERYEGSDAIVTPPCR